MKNRDILIEQSPCYELLQYNSHACSKAGNTLKKLIYNIAMLWTKYWEKKVLKQE